MKTYQAGIDVGSTTVKLVVLDENGQMIFGQYQRHLSHTQRALSDLLKQARAALGECALELRATGSGAINLAKALGIPFRYIPFTSDLDGKTGEVVRVHHHIIVNAEAAEIALEKWSAAFSFALPAAVRFLHIAARSPAGTRQREVLAQLYNAFPVLKKLLSQL